MEVADTELGSKFDKESLRAAETAHFFRKNPIPPAYNIYSFPTDQQLDVVLKNVARGMTAEESMRQYFEGEAGFLKLYENLKSQNGEKIKKPKSKHVIATKTVDGLVLVVDNESFYAGLPANRNGNLVLTDFASTISPRTFGMSLTKNDFMFVRESPVEVLVTYLEFMQKQPMSQTRDEPAAGIKAYERYLQEGGSKTELLNSMLNIYLAHERGEQSLNNDESLMQFQNIRDFFANLEAIKEYERINIPRLRHGIYAMFSQCIGSKAFHVKNDWHFSRALMLASLYTENPGSFYEAKLNYAENPSPEKIKKIMGEAQSLLWTKTHDYLKV